MVITRQLGNTKTTIKLLLRIFDVVKKETVLVVAYQIPYYVKLDCTIAVFYVLTWAIKSFSYSRVFWFSLYITAIENNKYVFNFSNVFG